MKEKKKIQEEKVENDFDLEAIKTYEENTQNHDTEFYDYEEVKKILGL